MINTERDYTEIYNRVITFDTNRNFKLSNANLCIVNMNHYTFVNSLQSYKHNSVVIVDDLDINDEALYNELGKLAKIMPVMVTVKLEPKTVKDVTISLVFRVMQKSPHVTIADINISVLDNESNTIGNVVYTGVVETMNGVPINLLCWKDGVSRLVDINEATNVITPDIQYKDTTMTETQCNQLNSVIRDMIYKTMSSSIMTSNGGNYNCNYRWR
jgi:hypothetical protein